MSVNLPRDGLYRAVDNRTELREESDVGPVLVGHFARFNEWTTIDSAFEGRFREMIEPGSFKKTFAEARDRIKVLFEHGKSPLLGNAPIASIRSLTEDDEGAAYEAPLLPGIPDLIIAGLRAGVYGASFRFKVLRDKVEDRPRATADNPDRLPTRRILEVGVHEFGPVTFPAYAGATAGIRSITDEVVAAGLSERLHLNWNIPWDTAVAPPADAGASPHLTPGRREPIVPVEMPSLKERTITLARAGQLVAIKQETRS